MVKAMEQDASYNLNLINLYEEMRLYTIGMQPLLWSEQDLRLPIRAGYVQAATLLCTRTEQSAGMGPSV